MRAWKLLPVLLILFFAAPASAQVSIWLQRGTSGFGANVGASATDNTTTGYVSGGYSYQGWIDFDLALRYITFDNFDTDDLSAFAAAPTIQFHPLKQSKTMPISLGLSAGIEIGALQSDVFADGESGRTFAVGTSANVYRFFKISDHFGIIPAAAVGYTHSSVTFEFADGTDVTFNGNSIGIGTAAYIAYLDDGNRIWGLSPSINFVHPFGDDAGDNFFEFGISFGIIFSQVPKE